VAEWCSIPASAEILWTVNKNQRDRLAGRRPEARLADHPVSADTTFTYQDPQGYNCSTDPAAYTNGFYQYNESNTGRPDLSRTGSDTGNSLHGSEVLCAGRD